MILPLLIALCAVPGSLTAASPSLRFRSDGMFKILQVADMHYSDGRSSPCLDVLISQRSSCSDLNTTAFVRSLALAEKPDLITFTGDNIFGFDATDAVKSLNDAFSPVTDLGIPWAAVLGNHDQESTLSREGVMKHIVSMDHTLSQLNPPGEHTIDGFGNYNLEVLGAEGSPLQNKSVLNLFFLDSGDYSTVSSIPGYGWIKASQQSWFQHTSVQLQHAYAKKPEPQKYPAPELVFFHIPLPEFANLDSVNITGVKQEPISSSSVNSGFFAAMAESGNTKACFVGHDHINDFCGKVADISLCYGGGFGYHAYGKAGWVRRARVVLVNLEKSERGIWGTVKSIKTWKRLDSDSLDTIDAEVLWSKNSARNHRKTSVDGTGDEL